MNGLARMLMTVCALLMTVCTQYPKTLEMPAFPISSGRGGAGSTGKLAELESTYNRVTLEGIRPAVSERKTDYQKRQTASEARCEEIWHRFEIEAGL